MKLKQMEEGNSTVFNMLTGVSWKEDNEILYDDSTVLVFNHQNDSSLAAITTKDDPHGHAETKEYLDKLDSLMLPDLDPEVRAEMDYGDIQLY